MAPNHDELRKLATVIARRLFTNGARERAQRLVLIIDTPTSRNLGGWSERAAIDQIADVLKKQRRDPMIASQPSPEAAKEPT